MTPKLFTGRLARPLVWLNPNRLLQEYARSARLLLARPPACRLPGAGTCRAPAGDQFEWYQRGADRRLAAVRCQIRPAQLQLQSPPA